MRLIRYRTGYKTSWADDLEDIGGLISQYRLFTSLFCLDQSKGEYYIVDNGIRTTVEYTINEGKKIKVRRRCSLFSIVVALMLEIGY